MAQKTNMKKTPDKGTLSLKKSTPLKISVCMIVRNEEKFLKKCLESIKAVADEIIIVDTGSEDRTVEIARGFTEKIYFHAWENSFSNARNQSLTHATGDWIFIIDADEELVLEDKPNLMKALQDKDVDVLMIQIVSQFMQGKNESIHNSERFFRNNGIIHYEGRVHNRLIGMRDARVHPMRIIHHGYDLNQIQSEKKFERTVSLLKMDLADDPYNPITYHYLSCSYLSRENYQQALETSLTAIRLAQDRNDRNLVYLWSRYNAAMSYYRLQEIEKAEVTALSALGKYANHIDSHFILILVYFDQKHWAKLIEHGTEYIRLIHLLKTSPTVFDNLVTCSLNEEWNMHVLIGIGYFELGQVDSAYDSFEMAVSSAPEPFIALRAVGIYFYNKKDTTRAYKYLEKAQRLNAGDKTVNDLLGQIPAASGKDQKEQAISCCMIVKNEESFLRKCLNSVKDYVDEIVIVDTGSTDKTVEIARDFTDKIYFHAWENSFSAARNQALAYATGDWIFQIDGDEELLTGSGERMRQAIREAGCADAIYLNIISTYSNGNKTARHNFERLFRNNGTIHYEGIVHNRVVGYSSVKASKIELMHHGYNVEEKKAYEKFIRTTELLKKQIAEQPDNPMPHHYLGASYLSRGLNKETANESVLAIDLADKQCNHHPLYLWTHHNAAIAFFRLGDLEKAEYYSLKALKKFTGHLDSFYILTMVAAEKGEWMNVLSSGEKYLERLHFYEESPDEAGLIINSTMKEGTSINLLMGHACHAFHEPERMEERYRNAYDCADEKWRVWWNIGTFHMDRSGDLELARKYLNMALAETPEAQPAWYMLAKLNKKCALFEEERHCLEQISRLKTDDPMILNRLSTLCIEAGNLDQALEATNAVLKTDAANYPALCNLGLIYKERKLLEDAVKIFTRAVEIHPYSASPWISLGEISRSLNKFADAKIFFERAISFQAGLTDVLLQLCDIELRINAIDDFVNHCDQLLKELGLNRNRILNNMEDIASLLLDIDFALRHRPESTTLVFNILSLLPVKYEGFYLDQDRFPGLDQDQEKSAFIMKQLDELSRFSESRLHD